MEEKPNEGSKAGSTGSKAAIMSRKISAEACPVVLTFRRPLMSLAKIGQGVNWGHIAAGVVCGFWEFGSEGKEGFI